VVNSTPTENGGSPIVTSIPLHLHGADLSVSFPHHLIANSTFTGGLWLVTANTARVLSVSAQGTISLQNGSLAYELMDEQVCAPIAFDTCP